MSILFNHLYTYNYVLKQLFKQQTEKLSEFSVHIVHTHAYNRSYNYIPSLFRHACIFIHYTGVLKCSHPEGSSQHCEDLDYIELKMETMDWL